MRCAGCEFENPEGMRFCGGCGRPLVGAVPPDAAPAGPEAERRQLTVLFCDMIDSTVFTERLDPEEWREVVRAYQDACARAVERFDGHIAQYLGDGIVAYFGYPRAHEDDAQRAVRAALETVEAMPAVNRRFDLAGDIAVRIALHTGVVVVGDLGGGRRERLAVGDAPNIAARLQALAGRNAVVVSGETHRLIEGHFDAEPLGERRLKGISRPVAMYAIRADTGSHGRADRGARPGRSPLVGRRDEVELLGDRWEEARAGHGRVVLLAGEPGIGKSRLVQAVRERVAGDGAFQVELRGSPYFQSSALFPVIETLQRAVGIQPADSPETRLAKLEQATRAEGQAAMLPLLAALLSLPAPAGHPASPPSPEQARRRTLEGIIGWWVARARRDPALIIVEDLHWLDPSTLELLGMLLPHVADGRILLLATHRPEFAPPWAGATPDTRLALNRLTRRQVGDLIAALSGDRTLPAATQERIAARADGVPLFVEELTRLVLESESPATGTAEAGARTAPAIPSTLRDSLMARLDRLGAAKEVAQRAAVLGREFGYPLLRAATGIDDAALAGALDRLVEARLLEARGRPPEAHYRFNHALIQEEAYQSLLRSARRAHHREAAEALERSFAEVADTQPEIVARHYAEAGVADRAVAFWQRAARRAVARSALEEAIQHFTRALELIDGFPADPQRTALELRASLGLATVLMVARGYGSTETGAACERALRASRALEETPLLFESLMLLWSSYVVRSEYATARELADQCMRIAERTGVPALLMWASLALGQTRMFSGELVAARPHLERAFAFYDPAQHRAQRASSTQDPGVMALANTAALLAVLGEPDGARDAARRARALARETEHPHTLVYALACAGAVLDYWRDVDGATAAAEELRAVAREEGFAFFDGVALMQGGRALVLAGRAADGVPQIEAGIDAARGTQGEFLVGYYMLRLAEAYAGAGRLDDARARWAEARERVERSGEAFYRPLLSQVEGDLHLARPDGDRAAAERCYLAAIEDARGRDARLYELTASIRLARLWREQGRIAAARDLIAGIYGRFTEGFDTADLREARALLDDLRPEPALPAR